MMLIGLNAYIVLLLLLWLLLLLLLLQLLVSFLHHFYPAYDSSISSYAIRMNKKEVERSGKNSKISSSFPMTSLDELRP